MWIRQRRVGTSVTSQLFSETFGNRILELIQHASAISWNSINRGEEM